MVIASITVRILIYKNESFFILIFLVSGSSQNTDSGVHSGSSFAAAVEDDESIEIIAYP